MPTHPETGAPAPHTLADLPGHEPRPMAAEAIEPATQAMLARAFYGLDLAIDNGDALGVRFWHVTIKTLLTLAQWGDSLAEKDALLQAKQTPSHLDAAYATLAVRVKEFPRISVEQLLTAQAVQRAGDGVTQGNVNTAQQLKNGVLTASNVAHDEHAALVVDGADNTLFHGSILRQGGAA